MRADAEPGLQISESVRVKLDVCLFLSILVSRKKDKKRRSSHTLLLSRYFSSSLRAEQLRQQLREERQRQYTCLISAVRRLQAVFRLQQHLKRKRAEERRLANEAAVVVQDFGKRAMAMVNAKKELARLVRARVRRQ